MGVAHVYTSGWIWYSLGGPLFMWAGGMDGWCSPRSLSAGSCPRGTDFGYCWLVRCSLVAVFLAVSLGSSLGWCSRGLGLDWNPAVGKVVLVIVGHVD